MAEELESKTLFTIPVFGGIPIAESVAVTWVIMAVLVILSLILVRNLKVENPGKKQLLLESGVSFLQDFFVGILGEEGKRYVPYLMSTVIFIGIANIAGVFGFTPPTKDMNVTIALSLMSIILIEYAGFHKRGLKGFLKSFAEPVPIMLPINILELAIRPTSLCMRLFGNVLGSFVVWSGSWRWHTLAAGSLRRCCTIYYRQETPPIRLLFCAILRKTSPGGRIRRR